MKSTHFAKIILTILIISMMAITSNAAFFESDDGYRVISVTDATATINAVDCPVANGPNAYCIYSRIDSTDTQTLSIASTILGDVLFTDATKPFPAYYSAAVHTYAPTENPAAGKFITAGFDSGIWYSYQTFTDTVANTAGVVVFTYSDGTFNALPVPGILPNTGNPYVQVWPLFDNVLNQVYIVGLTSAGDMTYRYITLAGVPVGLAAPLTAGPLTGNVLNFAMPSHTKTSFPYAFTLTGMDAFAGNVYPGSVVVANLINTGAPIVYTRSVGNDIIDISDNQGTADNDNIACWQDTANLITCSNIRLGAFVTAPITFSGKGFNVIGGTSAPDLTSPGNYVDAVTFWDPSDNFVKIKDISKNDGLVKRTLSTTITLLANPFGTNNDNIGQATSISFASRGSSEDPLSVYNVAITEATVSRKYVSAFSVFATQTTGEILLGGTDTISFIPPSTLYGTYGTVAGAVGTMTPTGNALYYTTIQTNFPYATNTLPVVSNIISNAGYFSGATGVTMYDDDTVAVTNTGPTILEYPTTFGSTAMLGVPSITYNNLGQAMIFNPITQSIGPNLISIDGAASTIEGWQLFDDGVSIYVNDCPVGLPPGTVFNIITLTGATPCVAGTWFDDVISLRFEDTTPAQLALIDLYPIAYGWYDLDTCTVLRPTEAEMAFFCSLSDFTEPISGAKFLGNPENLVTGVSRDTTSPDLFFGKEVGVTQAARGPNLPDDGSFMAKFYTTANGIEVMASDLEIDEASTTPEFSTWTLLLAVFVVGGFLVFVVRRRKQ